MLSIAEISLRRVCWSCCALLLAGACSSSPSAPAPPPQRDAGGSDDVTSGEVGYDATADMAADTSPDSAVDLPPNPVCGDGEVEGDEICDDGAQNGGPGHCDRDCAGLVAGCGDGQVADDEICDDGADNGTYGHCAADCAGPGPACGDGVLQAGIEVCDHGADNGTYGHCTIDCTGLGPHCGDGVKDDEEACDDGELGGEVAHCRLDCTGQTLPWVVATTSDTDGDVCEQHDWLAKYMRYRRRLRGDATAAFPGFVSVGTEPGESMPASRREPHADCHGNWQFESCPRDDLADAQGIFKWGDGTVWLGMYLDVLGTEYAVFSDLGLDTRQTEQDLYLALMAFNRLDEGADAFYNAPPTRDGYFLRDDVPRGFTVRDDGTYRFPRDDGDVVGYECVASDISCEPPATDNGSFTSQDQVIHLVHGMGLVARLIPDSVEFEGLPLAGAAREMVHRMVFNLRDNGWKVTAPDGDHPPGDWGGNAIGFSDHLAMAANAICGDEFGVDDYRNLASRTEGEAAWTGLQVIWGSTHNFNRTLALELAALTSVWDPDKMTDMAVGDTKDYYALTYSLLNGIDLPDTFSDWRIETVLDSASCHGPCRGYDDCPDAPGWKGENRIDGPGDRSGSRHYPKAEFNGLDYMALHNAYYLHKHGRVNFAAPEPTGSCDGFTRITDLLVASSEGATYDALNPCVSVDFGERYCGRPWASWLDDAYRGKVTIFTGGYRWQCDPGQPCVLMPNDGHTNTDDLILGSPGDDTLYGGSGNDCLVGFGGNDVIEGGQGYDDLYGGPGNDELYGESSGIVLDGERDRLFGGDGDDFLKGGPDADALYGGPGQDQLQGDGGDDILEGGEGNDTLRGNEDDDTLTGGLGDDSLIGDGGDDVLWGGPGRDKLDGETGNDSCDGEEGDDFVRGGAGDDHLVAGTDGADRLCGNGGDDVLWGGWDGDQCLGGGFLGGTDEVHGCDDDSATTDECDNGAFAAW